MKSFSLEAQDRKTKVSKLMRGKFFSINFLNAFYGYDFTDIDECKGSHSCHVYVNVTLDILEMDKTAQVNLISSLQYVEQSCMTPSTTVLHHSAALQDN